MIVHRYYDEGWRWGFIFKRGPKWVHLMSTETGDVLKLPAREERDMQTFERISHYRTTRHLRHRYKVMGRAFTKTQRAALRAMKETTND